MHRCSISCACPHCHEQLVYSIANGNHVCLNSTCEYIELAARVIDAEGREIAPPVAESDKRISELFDEAEKEINAAKTENAILQKELKAVKAELMRALNLVNAQQPPKLGRYKQILLGGPYHGEINEQEDSHNHIARVAPADIKAKDPFSYSYSKIYYHRTPLHIPHIQDKIIFWVWDDYTGDREKLCIDYLLSPLRRY